MGNIASGFSTVCLMMKGSCFQPPLLFNLLNEVVEESETLNEITNAMGGKSPVIVNVPLKVNYCFKCSFAVTIVYILYKWSRWSLFLLFLFYW